MKKYATLLISLLITSNIVSAQTQAEMNTEAMNAYKKSDKELNVYYKKIVNTIDSKSKEKLIKTQRLWIQYRDTYCDFDTSPYEGGTIKPLMKYSCLKTLTDQQIDNLKNSYNRRDY